MESESSSTVFQSVLEAMKSADAIEKRIHLLNKLEDLNFSEKSDLSSLAKSLSTFWEDFTCLDASQCALNWAILRVATKFVDSELSGCLVQLLALGSKAAVWCGKHLKMTLLCSEESQDQEHYNLFFQLLLEFLSLSMATIMALTRNPVLTDKESVMIVERFILEQLNLTKDIISEIKKIDSFGSEVVKNAQAVIDAVLGFCKEYSQAMNWDLYHSRPEKDENNIDFEGADTMNHVISIIKCTVEKLCELGVLAANDGGSLVAILNVSWKGVISLLQLGKGALADMISVQGIIATLISLVSAPLRCAAEAWSSSLKETVSVNEARRAFLPIKFYLINAVKISSLYPCQAYLVYRELSICILMLSTFKVLLSYKKFLNTASEVFSDLLEKTTMDLLLSLLNSAEVKQELKFQLLDFLFSDDCCSNSTEGDYHQISSMLENFSISCEAMHGDGLLLLGRVALFYTLLRYSAVLEEGVKIQIAKKLGWFFDLLVHQDVYSSILDLQVPMLYGTEKTMELIWQPMFSAVLHALKAFMIVVSSSVAWLELVNFMLENLFHPHFLCWEIVMELWCFLVRYGDIDVVKSLVDKLFSLMKLLASPDSVIIPGSPLRKMARAICLLLSNDVPSIVDQVYCSVVDDTSQLSSVMLVAFILEGFPLKLLPDSIRNVAKQNIVTDYSGFIENLSDKLWTAHSSAGFVFPVYSLSASLHSHLVSIFDVDVKTLKFLVAIIRNFRNSTDKVQKEYCQKLLCETLEIISTMKHLYKSYEMEEVIFELQNLFLSGTEASDTLLYLCKPYVAIFMGGLGDTEMSETDDCAKTSAVWYLYHMLFQERHWALIHLTIASFGYFAARTSCNQLWRFVPQDAALSYDLMSGNEVNEDRFMSELKAFLEKELAILTIAPCFEELECLVREGMVLKEMVQKIPDIRTEAMECETVEIDVNNQSNKRRKLPAGIGSGVELLQSGLKVIGDSLSEWQQNQSNYSQVYDKFLTHFSRLEDVIAQLIGLADNV